MILIYSTSYEGDSGFPKKGGSTTSQHKLSTDMRNKVKEPPRLAIQECLFVRTTYIHGYIYGCMPCMYRLREY